MAQRVDGHRLSQLGNWLIVLALTFGGGCGTSAFPPPVKIEFRDSIVGLGKVVKIKNDSSHHLYNVTVVGRNLEHQTSASVRASEHLAPDATVEVGWLEFEKWVPEPGETIEVRCDNYALPMIAIIPRSK